MKRRLSFLALLLVGGLLFYFSSPEQDRGPGNSLVPTGSSGEPSAGKVIVSLKDRVSAFGEACAKWGVGSRQAYSHATDLVEADFASTPLTPAEIREMRTEFVETIMERRQYEEAVEHLQKIIAEEQEEQSAQADLGTRPNVGYMSRIGEAQAMRASMLGRALSEIGQPFEAYQSFRASRDYLGTVYGPNHPNLIYVYQDEIEMAERARAAGHEIGSLFCDKRDLRIMQTRAVSEAFVDDDEIVQIRAEAVVEDSEPICPDAPSIPVERSLEKIKVFYGTNRNYNKTNSPKKTYGNKRGRLTMGSIDMSVRVYPKVGDLPPAGIRDELIDDDGDAQNYGVHIILNKVNRSQSKPNFVSELENWAGRAGTSQREVFVYVHGHNVVFEAAARRTAQLAIDLDMRNGAIMYSWPAGQRMTLYAKSQINARRSASSLTEFLETLANVEQIDKIHLIAHSMGNAVLTRALNEIEVAGFSTDNRPFGQIVWASPDVASIDFVNYTTKFKNEKLADGMTLYASSLDRALCLSNWLSDMKRAGQTPPLADVASVVPTIDTSGGSRASTDLIAHSDYADGAIDDIKAVLWLNLRPDQRCFLGNNLIDDVAYWATGKGKCSEEAFRSALSIVRASSKAQTNTALDFSQTIEYIRRDVEPEQWELAQLLANTIDPEINLQSPE